MVSRVLGYLAEGIRKRTRGVDFQGHGAMSGVWVLQYGRQVIGLEWLGAPHVTPSHRGQAEMGLSGAGWHAPRGLKGRV